MQRPDISLGETRERANHQMRGGNSAPDANQYDGARRNTLKTMVIAVIMYVICWTPNECMWGLQYFGWITINYTSWAFRLSFLAQFSYCFISPLIYVFKYKDFRQGYAQLAFKILPPKLFRFFVSQQIEVSSGGTVTTVTRPCNLAEVNLS